MSLTKPRLMRRCARCQERKPLAEFWRQADIRRRYGDYCHACQPPAEKTKVCRHCGRRKYLRSFTTHNSSKDGLEHRCKSCVRKYNRSRYRKAGGFCLDCNKPSHFRRCEACREKFQAQAEAMLAEGSVTDGLCGIPTRAGGCLEPLSFGTDFLGRTTTNCVRHGERLLPVRGVHHYDQRVTFEDEQDAAFERACKPPQPNAGARQNGEHFRRQSGAYVGEHPWRQKKRSAA